MEWQVCGVIGLYIASKMSPQFARQYFSSFSGFFCCETFLYHLLAVSRHACCSRGSLCVCGCHSLRICLVEDSLEHLLLFCVQDLRQVLIKLRLLLLEACRETSVECLGYRIHEK